VSLRARFLLAFLLVAALPVALLAVLVQRRVARAYDESARERLRAAIDVTRGRLDRLRARAEAQTAALATIDLPLADGELATALEALGVRRDLPALEVLDERRILASRQWPSGVGLPDADVAFAGSPFRLEKSAAGFGAQARLAVVSEERSLWRARPVLVRGGYFLDGAVVEDLGLAAGCRLGFYDARGLTWTAPPDSPLLEWRPPSSLPVPMAELSLGGQPWRYASTPLAPSLLLVAALPRSDLDRVLDDVRGDTATAGLLALALALLFGVALAQRLSAPVRELAASARRVARGDFDTLVDPSAPGELGDLARAFRAMTDDLQASRERLIQAERVAAWREMARRLAHELKNPMFPIQVSLDTLGRALERDPQRFAELFRESSATIRQELLALRRIVDEFAEFARMPRPQLRPTDVNAVAEQALSLHRPRAPGIRFETDLASELAPASADPDLLGRALSNLVANAIEAMPAGGELRLRTRAEAGQVRVEVEDTGPGLSEEQRTRLFTPYFTTKKGGTGLGLAVVQGIVSDHGGRVEVRSSAGQGTTFVLSLPAASA
jgi:nitrogen fixation/metabolism regulation signal transduction histidine kinase